MIRTAAAPGVAPTAAPDRPTEPEDVRSARRRHPTARPWRTDPERLRRRLAEALVAQGRTPVEAEAEARAAALEAARRRPAGRPRR